jgi:glycosyltransferase involved in cell wall biosynthesis
MLKKAGKGIVVTYQGDDARQGEVCLKNFEINPASEVEPGYYSAKSDAHKRFLIKKFAKYADRIYALNPDLLWVLPPCAQFLPYSHIDLRDWRSANNGNLDSKVPVILHAPSHRGVKGTNHVLDVVSRLKREGLAIDFRLVEGVPQAEARRIYERADLLIDQLLCGWYGGLAVEFMALGKPVICYIREGDLKFVPEQMRKDLPVINATPTTIYGVLKEWLTVRRHELEGIGRRGRAYVERWHDPLKIAAKLKGEYEAILASKQ